ncbi:MAG TPA: zinc ribbon domain-containing protein [Pyrinomonadaceae bacterium]|nr:zinc ribbon domain-containing protein [Pyrinomonadaceae bacterium]
MYCPSCGTDNIKDANFCRGCGADLAPVSQALSGNVPGKRTAAQDLEVHPYEDYKRHKRGGKEPRIDKAIPNIFTGIGFILVAAMVYRFAPAGKIWWFWMLIPAFTMLGGGIAEYVRYKHYHKGKEPELPASQARAAVPPARVSALPPRDTSEMVPPPSVTEGTTRHLNVKAEAPPRDT